MPGFQKKSKTMKNWESDRKIMSPRAKSPVTSHVESDSDEEDAGALSIKQILALKEQFDASDIDGGGSLDIDEVKS